MSYNSSVYNEAYYKSHCGDDYSRGNGWEEIFARQAERIVKELHPKTVLDVGCAAGYLVEGLRDRNADAKGIDVSEYALSCVREDIKPFCILQSATEPIKDKYDLITCIEVLEHLAPDDFSTAIDNMCNATDMILFSSTPFDYNEETHYSVNSTSFWVEKFAYNGFYHDISYDASYIAVQAMLFRKSPKSNVDLIRDYEIKLFELWRENCVLRDKVNLSNARISDLDLGNIKHAQEIQRYQTEINDLGNRFALQMDEECKKREDQISEYEQKIIELKKHTEAENERLNKQFNLLLEREYSKRDELQNKCRITARRIVFLESELNRYVQENKVVINEIRGLKHELYRYKNGRIYQWANKLDHIVKRWQAKHGAYSDAKLLKRKKDFWNAVFNAEEYASFNPDIREAIGTDEDALLKHFICHGMKERRIASHNFNVYIYMSSNDDICEAYGDNFKQYYLHYINFGIKENRKAN